MPERPLRCLVLGVGAVLGLTGAAMILTQTLPAPLRAALGLAWLAIAAGELWRTASAYRSSRAYRLHADGSIDILGPGGSRRAAVFASGSVVLPRLAWVSIRPASGRPWGELVRGDPRKNEEWRRLQVICRQLAAC